MNNNRVTKNTFLNTIKSVASLLFPLITFPYISRILLTDNVGKINFGNSIISYFSLIASLGIYTYAIRECSKVRDKKETLNRLASEIYSLNIITTFISYILLFFLLIFVADLENYKFLIVLQSFSILCTTIGADWINYVEEDFGFITARTLFFQALSIVLMFIFIHQPSDYIKYAFITLLSSSGAQITNIIYRRKYCTIKLTTKINWKKHLQPVLLLFSMQLAMIIYVNSDVTILGFVKGDTEVGLYSVSVKVYNIVQIIITAVQNVVIPKLAIHFSKKDYKSVNETLRYAFNFEMVLGLPCIIGINLVAEGVVLFLAGEDYLECIPSLRILMLALFASSIAGFINNLIMLPSGRDKLCMVSSCISAGLNLVLNLILIPFWGLNAAAFTTLISMVVGFFIKYPFVEKEINFRYIFKDSLSPVIGCILMSVDCLLIGQFCKNIYVKTIVQIGSAVAIYFCTLLVMRNAFLLDSLKPILIKLKKGKN